MHDNLGIYFPLGIGNHLSGSAEIKIPETKFVRGFQYGFSLFY